MRRFKCKQTKLKVNVTKVALLFIVIQLLLLTSLLPLEFDTVDIVTPYANNDSTGDYTINYSGSC